MELETYKCAYQKSEMHTAQCSEVKTANHCINAWQPVLTSADVSFTQSRSGQVTHVTLKTWAVLRLRQKYSAQASSLSQATHQSLPTQFSDPGEAERAGREMEQTGSCDRNHFAQR